MTAAAFPKTPPFCRAFIMDVLASVEARAPPKGAKRGIQKMGAKAFLPSPPRARHTCEELPCFRHPQVNGLRGTVGAHAARRHGASATYMQTAAKTPRQSCEEVRISLNAVVVLMDAAGNTARFSDSRESTQKSPHDAKCGFRVPSPRRQRAGAREERMRFSSAQHRRNRAPDGGVSPSSSHSKKKPRMPH